jgi:hypothetical protein
MTCPSRSRQEEFEGGNASWSKQVKILGVGLSKTGTSSLNHALGILGFNSIHHEPERMRDIITGKNMSANFRVYDDVDAVTDLPAAYFYKELIAAYPKCKCILTIRDEDKWWISIEKHFNQRNPIETEAEDPLNWHTRRYAYGSATAKEHLYRQHFRDHNQSVQSTIPQERLLLMNITAGDGWDKLCPFLNCELPAVRFPCIHADHSVAVKKATATIRSLIRKDSAFVLVDHGVIKRSNFPDYEVKALMDRNGVDFGFPLNDEAAIEEVDELLKTGISHIVIAWTAFWFFDYYQDWKNYMYGEFEVVFQSEELVIFDLNSTP